MILNIQIKNIAKERWLMNNNNTNNSWDGYWRWETSVIHTYICSSICVYITKWWRPIYDTFVLCTQHTKHNSKWMPYAWCLHTKKGVEGPECYYCCLMQMCANTQTIATKWNTQKTKWNRWRKKQNQIKLKTGEKKMNAFGWKNRNCLNHD